MDEDQYDVWLEGRAPINECVAATTRIMREQIAEAPNLTKIERAMMTLGSLLASVPEADKDELFHVDPIGGTMSTDELPEAIEEVAPDWRPRGELDVERGLRGLSRLASRFAQVRHQAGEWRSDIDLWETQQIARISASATQIVLGLEHWALDQRAASRGKTKSWSFPSGTVETNKARGKTMVEDEAACIEWCRENLPDAVKVETSLLKSVITKQCKMTDDGRFVTDDGEFVPGVRQQILPDSAASAVVTLANNLALPKAER